jgi:AcrR family transcriptional regulator
VEAEGSKARSPAKKRGSSTLREAQKAFTRQRLVEAARATFERKGYVDTTIDDIVDAAGASRATFYLYFPSKAEVMLSVIAAWRDPGTHLTETWPPGHEPYVAELETSVNAYLDRYIESKDLLRAWTQAQVIEPELHHVALEELDQNLERWIRLGIVRRSSHHDKRDDETLRLQGMMFFAQVQKFFEFWIVHGWQADRDQVVRMTAERWYEVLFGEPPTPAAKVRRATT